MALVHDIAAMLIDEQHAAGRTIDKMQLQKLLYLVQGAHLAFWGEEAFRDEILAYTYGPVVATVEDTYRTASDGQLIERPLGGRPERLDPDLADTVRTIVARFGSWTGPNLAAYVKRPGSPWRSARNGLPDSAPSRAPIEAKTIREWFDSHGVDPNPPRARAWEPTEDERRLVDERIRQARASGVFNPGMTPELEEIARRALARISRDDSAV